MAAISWPSAANVSLLFADRPLLERPAAAAAAGFDAIEMWWPFGTPRPTAAEVAELIRAVDEGGLPLVALNFAAGDMAAGERGLVSDPQRVDEFRASVQVAAHIAARTGCRLFNALYGNARPGVERAAQAHAAATNLAYAARTVTPFGGTVLVESLNVAENANYLLPRSVDAARVVRSARANGEPNVALLADVYHWAAGGEDPAAAIEQHAELIGHVQVADSPGRAEPGTGQIDFGAVYAALHRVGYTGVVAAEYRPAGLTEDGLDWRSHLALDVV